MPTRRTGRCASWACASRGSRASSRSGRRRSSRRRRGSSRCPSKALRPVVVDDLDVVAVGVEHERGVVAGVVLGPLAGRAVVAVAGAGGGLVEGVDGVVVVRREGNVKVLGRLVARHERERVALGVEELLPARVAGPVSPPQGGGRGGG